MTDNLSDRRAHDRIDSRLVFEGIAGEPDTVARMVASNLSLGGVYCTSSSDFPEMTRLGVRIPLPSHGALEDAASRILEMEAVVVRRKQLPSPSGGEDRFELALFFTSISDAQKEMLSEYLQATSPA